MEPNKIHPRAPPFFLKHYGWAAAIAVLLLPAGWFVLSETRVMEYALGMWALAALIFSIALIHTRLHQRVYLALSEEEIVYESGILSRTKAVVPLHNVTDTSVYASWFDRLLGCATLSVNTAGGKDFEIVAKDFPCKDLDAIHGQLMKLVRRTPSSLPDTLALKPPADTGKK